MGLPPPKGRFAEDDLEKAIVALLCEQGYEHVEGKGIHRRFEDVLLEGDLRAFLSRRHPDLTEAEMDRVVDRLRNIPAAPLYAGSRETFLLVNEGFSLAREGQGRAAAHVCYIDFDRPGNNSFKVVTQFEVRGERLRRPDLLLFINGMPVAIFEFKTAVEENKTTHDAWEQICGRYCRDIPKLMRHCFLAVVSDGANTKMGSVFTPYEYYYPWNKANDEERVSSGIPALLTMIKGAFAKDRVLAILRDFVCYPDDGAKNVPVVARYPQFFAANRMLDSIRAQMGSGGAGKGGTYFGATGCGKTHIMLFLARLLALRDRETFGNPTIVVIADRDDLEAQTAELFAASKRYLHETNVRSIESRRDLAAALGGSASGGVFVTTVQKFCAETGLLSERRNIICISDEAHRTQVKLGPKLKQTENGVFTTYGFAKYLRDGLPNATYCGFTGTPIDETIFVFGDVVDAYTMQEATDDGITVRIAYEPRLARVLLSDEQARDIQKYYDKCLEEGANREQVEESKRAMSRMEVILGDPDRLRRLAADIVGHYEALCAQKPKTVQKAMVVCYDRKLAFGLLKEIVALRPDWNVPRKAEDGVSLSEETLDRLIPLEKIKLVATQGPNDEKELFDLCGTKDHRKMLDRQFKDTDSNFRMAVVVDMWITGFDVPSLAVMYIDKPLQRHTLIQTISRVNRVFNGKDRGLVVDYIGFRKDMMEALKRYGGPQKSPVEGLDVSLGAFRNHLELLDALMHGFDAGKFFSGSPLERLQCLNGAAEFVQSRRETQTRFMGLALRLKAAYDICCPSGELSDAETARAQFYLAVRSIVYKQTKGDAPDSEVMNSVVEKMVQEAITCSGVENIINMDKQVDLFSDKVLAELESIGLPFSKFNALLKLLKRAISEYGKINMIQMILFNERLQKIVDKYNDRDNLVFATKVKEDVINGLSHELISLFHELNAEKTSFEKLDITFEEKAFYDILIKVRDDHGFKYENEKCVMLATEIKKLVDDKMQFADWSTRDDIKSKLDMDLTVLLYNNGYPPEWNEDVFTRVLEQAENFKKWAG